MKTYTVSELAEITENHGKWLRGEDGGERANLGYANLGYANLGYANLGGANLRGANLRGADLRGADLGYANLGGANLGYANLRDANLRDANLRDANLRGANLRGADLRGADLRGADLSCANLSGATGNMLEIKSVQCYLWPVTYTADRMQIGCQAHLISEWWAFSDLEVERMDSQALAWWAIWKPILQNIIEVSPANAGRIDTE